MLHTYLLKHTSNISLEEFEELLNRLDTRRIEKIRKLRTWSDKVNSLYSGLLLRYMLEHLCRIDASEQIFYYNEFDKPYLLNYPNIFFSISHSNEYVICSICDREIGVDIEKYNPDLSVDEFSSVFPPFEWKVIKNSQDNRMFFKHWVLKEAYVKKLGYGLHKELSSFYMYDQPDGIIVVDNELLNHKEYFYFEPSNDWFLAICTDIQESITIEYINEKKLLKQ